MMTVTIDGPFLFDRAPYLLVALVGMLGDILLDGAGFFFRVAVNDGTHRPDVPTRAPRDIRRGEAVKGKKGFSLSDAHRSVRLIDHKSPFRGLM